MPSAVSGVSIRGDTIAVLGGPIGLLSVLAAKANQARVVAIEPQARRREIALRLGAAYAIDPTATDFRDSVAEIADGRGFDAVIEAAAPRRRWRSPWIAAHSGRLAYAGIGVGATAPAALGLIQSKALRLQGLIGSMGIWPQTIRFLASGVVDPSKIVTASVPLAEADDALAAARTPPTTSKCTSGRRREGGRIPRST